MKVVLNDGTEIQNAMVGKMNNFLELTMSKTDATVHFAKFMDPEVMSVIDFYEGIWKTTYTGFNRLSHIENPKEDEMRVWMEGTFESTVGEPIVLVDPMYVPEGLKT